jgi:hypothetical protein
MNKKKSFFDIASKVFWLLLIVIAIMSILHLDFGIFETQKIAEEIVFNDSISDIIQIDSIHSFIEDDSLKVDDRIQFEWMWSSFDDKKYQLLFQLNKNQVINASINRENSNNAGGTLYQELYEYDRKILQSMIEGYKAIIKNNNLDYYAALDMVVTSIQSIPYTLVLDSEGIMYKGEWVKCPCQTAFGYFKGNCSVMPNGDGCCNDIEPWGVFSPVEFATRKTGDCDTRSLFAFTILKNLGFEVAVMGSRNEGHSVLGVKVPSIPGDGRRGDELDAREYFLWELTSYGHRLGDYIKGNDWEIEYN